MKEINLTYFESKGKIYIPFDEHLELLGNKQHIIDKVINYLSRDDLDIRDEWLKDIILEILKGEDKK